MIRKKIFISYRRSDSAGHAGRLYDHLTNYFGAGWIFFDVDTIELGSRFEQKIRGELEMSDVVLVLIGNQWLDIKDKNGNRRLDDPNDFVRLEIETAFNKGVTVIPVLLQEARMPSEKALPEKLSDLSKYQAINLNDDNWSSDIKNLTRKLKTVLGIARNRKEDKFRGFLKIIFTLSIISTILGFLNLSSIDAIPMFSILVSVSYAMLFALNLIVISYLLGNSKRELGQSGARIIILAWLANIISMLYKSAPVAYIPPILLLAVAFLFTLLEPDE